MKNVALGDFFSGKIACEKKGVRMAMLRGALSRLTYEKTRAHGKLIPLAFGHKLPFLVQKFFVSPVHFGRPSLVLIIRRFAAVNWRLLLLLLLWLSLARRSWALSWHAGKVLVLDIQGLEGTIASLLCIGRSLVLRMIGSDIIVGIIIGVRSGLFLRGGPSRQIGGRWQR